MNFSCPECKLSGKIDDAKIPEKGIYATCPKCKTRFLVKLEESEDTIFYDEDSTQVYDGEALNQSETSQNVTQEIPLKISRPPIQNLQTQTQAPVAPNPAVSNENNMAIFVGKNSEKYLRKFASFNTSSADGFAMTWHWPALFAPFWWFLYRKLYLWAVLAFIIGFIPYINILARFAFALTANYIYYAYSKKKMSEIKVLPTDLGKAVAMSRYGGVNNLIWVVAPIIAIAIIGILAAIAIPQFHSYRMKAFNSAAISELKKAKSGVDTYYDSNKALPSTLDQVQYRKQEKIDVGYETNQTDKYVIKSSHQNGDKEYAASSDSPALMYKPKSDKTGDYKQIE